MKQEFGIKIVMVGKELKALVRRMTMEHREDGKLGWDEITAKHALTQAGEWLQIPEGASYPPETWLPVYDLTTVIPAGRAMDREDIEAKWEQLRRG